MQYVGQFDCIGKKQMRNKQKEPDVMSLKM